MMNNTFDESKVYSSIRYIIALEEVIFYMIDFYTSTSDPQQSQ